MSRIQEICEAHNLTLVEDAAQAHGAMYNGEKVGGFGQFGCFSFYATKNMITGEGGMVTTSEKAYAERLRLIINHGQSEKYPSYPPRIQLPYDGYRGRHGNRPVKKTGEVQ